MVHYRPQTLRHIKHSRLAFRIIYPLVVLFSFHNLIVAYSNSTYLENYVQKETVGTLFMIGSAISVLAFLVMPHVLSKIGNVRLTVLLTLIYTTGLITLGLASQTHYAVFAFIIYASIGPLIYLNIDIFSESIIGNDESATGTKRGLVLGLMSLAAVFAPLVTGYIVGDDSSRLYLTYFVAAGIFVPFIFLIATQFKNFVDPVYEVINVRSMFSSLLSDINIRNVFASHFLLQIFFTWMIIYVPLYLATVMDLSWAEIGSIIAVAITAYVLVEYPAGLIADKYIGEKEMMITGFLILAVTSTWIAFMSPTASIISWMVLLFVSRIGASFCEITTESFFFKHTSGSDANLISVFRILRPLAGVLGAFFGIIALIYLPFNLIFVVLGLMMIPGIFFTLALKDTK